MSGHLQISRNKYPIHLGMQMTQENNNNNIVAYVECPPYPLAQLQKEEEFTIGRGVYNRLVLSLDNVSRYHAVIKWGDNGFIIEDLGSSNGTFVNDEIIETQHKLQAGDKILIGNQLITYRESEKKSEYQHNKTLKTDMGQNVFRVPSVEEIKHLRSSLQGNIETIPLFSVLQMLSGDNQTGCLTIQNSELVGDIYFKEGSVINTQISSGAVGENAFFSIMKWEKGQFQFHKEKLPLKETMQENLQRLLLEGLRILDES
ncbi:DUF4388 domain-containing protein [Candidatus Uabimicrobium sp. HlEnr_7]|uniref:DUF4388 domain-containing protein n=1 Tax=Candidatus Uabimicrobium helgolandensis TaxID=3095367 RepID=UPI003555C2EA